MSLYSSILVPVAPDHAVDFEKILTIARLLSGGNGEITVLSVVEDIPKHFARDLPPEFNQNVIGRTQEEVLRALGEHDDVKLVVKLGHASTQILRHAEKNSVDCIVLASRRPELADIFLGSTATRVARRTDASVVIVR